MLSVHTLCLTLHILSPIWGENTVLDHGRGQGVVGKGGLEHPDDICGRALQPRWRTGSPWLLDHYDEAGREEQSSPTFDLQ